MNRDDVGRTVVARVTRIEVYGLYLEFGGKQLVVLLPGVSYEPVPDLKAKYKPGDELSVRVIACVEDRQMYKGTIKDA